MLAMLAAVTLAACASTPMTPDTDLAKVITPAQAASCKQLMRVVYDESFVTRPGKSPWLWQFMGDLGIRKAAFAAGGNAVVVTSTESNWFVGTFDYREDAYRCTG